MDHDSNIRPWVQAAEAKGATVRWAELKVNAPAHNFYAFEASHKLGLGDKGAMRAGLAPYSTKEDVDRLVEGLKSF